MKTAKNNKGDIKGEEEAFLCMGKEKTVMTMAKGAKKIKNNVEGLILNLFNDSEGLNSGLNAVKKGAPMMGTEMGAFPDPEKGYCGKLKNNFYMHYSTEKEQKICHI